VEQYLDSLEGLPTDLRRNLALMQENDKKSQSFMNQIYSSVQKFVASANISSPSHKQKQYEEIKDAWQKAKGFADDKVQLASQTYELVDKHIRRLDTDLARFEAELKQKLSTDVKNDANQSPLGTLKKSVAADKKKPGASKTAATSGGFGRKRLFENGKLKSNKKQKLGVKSSTADCSSPELSTAKLSRLSGTALIHSLAGSSSDVLDMPIDPNEPTYCICNQVSYGEMIGCDNAECPIEWFHFNCVGLTNKPKGKWYCERCSDERKKKTVDVL